MPQLTNHHAKNTNAKNNAIIAAGVLIQDTESGKIKVGDGVTHWKDLPYLKVDSTHTIGPFAVDYSSFLAGEFLTPKTLFVPIVGMVVHSVYLDTDTAVAFTSTDAAGMDIGQDLDFDPAHGWIGDGMGFDPTAPADFAGLAPAYSGVVYAQKEIVISSTNPVSVQLDDVTGTPVDPPGAGHYDFYFHLTFP